MQNEGSADHVVVLLLIDPEDGGGGITESDDEVQYIFRGEDIDDRFEVYLVGIEALQVISIISILIQNLIYCFLRFVDPPHIRYHQIDNVWQYVPVPHTRYLLLIACIQLVKPSFLHNISPFTNIRTSRLRWLHLFFFFF